MSEDNGSERSLLQRFPHLAPDDDLLKIVAWCEKLEGKIDTFGDSFNTWTRAILNQGELATAQNRLVIDLSSILQQTGQTNEALGETLLQFKTDLTQLQTEFKLLKDVINGREQVWTQSSDSITSISKDLSVNLKPQIEKIWKKLEKLDQSIGQSDNYKSLFDLIGQQNNDKTITVFGQIAKVNNRIEILTAERRIIRIALGLLAVLVLVQFFWLNWQINRVNKNVNTGLVQLQRLRGN